MLARYYGDALSQRLLVLEFYIRKGPPRSSRGHKTAASLRHSHRNKTLKKTELPVQPEGRRFRCTANGGVCPLRQDTIALARHGIPYEESIAVPPFPAGSAGLRPGAGGIGPGPAGANVADPV